MPESANDRLISVVMPLYNEERHLDMALSSFFSQTIADKCEIICVDDGSTDSTPETLEAYRSEHASNMVVLIQSNKGAGPARNAGIQKARGEFVGFLDADDLYPSMNVLETLYKVAKESGASIAGGSLIVFTEEGESTDFVGVEGFEGYQFLRDGIVEYKDYQFDYGYQRFIYSVPFLREHGLEFPNYLRYQDPPFFVRAMLLAERFYAVVQHTYKYRASTSQAVNWTEEKMAHMLAAINEIAVLAVENDLPDLFKLNMRRLDVDNQPVFHQAIITEGNLDILQALREARSALIDMGAKHGITGYSVGESPVEQEVLESLMHYDSLKQTIRESGELIDELDNKLDWCNQELNRMKASTTWKTGRMVTAVPRFLKDRHEQKLSHSV